VLAGGQLHYTHHSTLRFDHYVTLKREWEPAGKGTTVTTLGTSVFLFLQQRRAYVGHEALLDLRVRRALAHAIDRDLINEGLFDGLSAPTDTPVPPNVPIYPDVERALTHYPLDVNRAGQLMGEAGFTRDAEGFFADAQGRRFFVDFAVQNSTEIERMQQILSDSWRRSGFEVHTVVMQSRLFTEAETRQTLPGLAYALFGGAEGTFRSSEVGTPANRWSGNNRGGWTSSEYDRLYDAWSSTLDPAERGRYVGQMMGLVSENLPGYALYFPLKVRTWVSSLHGPTAAFSSGFGRTSSGTTDYWNIQDWTLD
jgi:ABC-type transport system substrate-binding protein